MTAENMNGVSPDGSRQSRKRRRTRESILNAAWLCFSRADADEVSLRDIAELADVSEATVYNHFKNRAELLEAVVSYGQPGLNDMIEAVKELGEAQGPFEVLRLFAQRIRSEDPGDLHVLRKFREITRSAPELRMAYLTRREQSNAVLLQALSEKAAAVSMSQGDLALLCEAYVHLSEGVSAKQDEESTPASWADDLLHVIDLLEGGWQR